MTKTVVKITKLFLQCTTQVCRSVVVYSKLVLLYIRIYQKPKSIIYVYLTFGGLLVKALVNDWSERPQVQVSPTAF